MPAQVHRTLSCVLGRHRAVKQALALGIQITQLIGLKPVGQNAEQKVGQARGRRSSECILPSDPKFPDVEIAQARNLDVDRLTVRWCGTDLDARHGRSGRPALGSTGRGLAAAPARDLVNPVTVYLP